MGAGEAREPGAGINAVPSTAWQAGAPAHDHHHGHGWRPPTPTPSSGGPGRSGPPATRLPLNHQEPRWLESTRHLLTVQGGVSDDARRPPVTPTDFATEPHSPPHAAGQPEPRRGAAPPRNGAPTATPALHQPGILLIWRDNMPRARFEKSRADPTNAENVGRPLTPPTDDVR